MVSLKTEGIVLMTLGVIVMLGTPIITLSDPDWPSVSELDAVRFGLGEVIGLVLIGMGAWPYYLSWKTGKRKGA